MPKIPDARTPLPPTAGGVHTFVVRKPQQGPLVDPNDAPNLNKPASPAPAPRVAAKDGFEAAAKGTAAKAGAEATVNGRPPATPHLVYWGGKILTQPKVVNLFVGDYWNSDAGKADQAHMNGFAKEFGGSPMFDMLTPEYGVGRPEMTGSTVIPGDVKTMNSDDVAAAVQKAIAAGGLPTDPETIYSIQLPPGAVLSHGNEDSTQGLGGFHGSYIDPTSKKPVYYAAIAYADGQNGIQFTPNSRDNNTITLSHELIEAITDPDIAQAHTYGDLGYYDPLGGEIGDLAVNDGAMPLSEAFGRDKNGYAVQVEWDNKTGAFGIGPNKPPKIITAAGNNAANAKLTATELQTKVNIGKAIDINKAMLTITLNNPKNGKVALTLTSPSGQAIPVNVPPVPNFHGELDLSPYLAGQNAKGAWILSATDPNGAGITLKNWKLETSGIAQGSADAKVGH